jgi:hypothetical protein
VKKNKPFKVNINRCLLPGNKSITSSINTLMNKFSGWISIFVFFNLLKPRESLPSTKKPIQISNRNWHSSVFQNEGIELNEKKYFKMTILSILNLSISSILIL